MKEHFMTSFHRLPTPSSHKDLIDKVEFCKGDREKWEERRGEREDEETESNRILHYCPGHPVTLQSPEES